MAKQRPDCPTRSLRLTTIARRARSKFAVCIMPFHASFIALPATEILKIFVFALYHRQTRVRYSAINTTSNPLCRVKKTNFMEKETREIFIL